jgi:hypothetical protein
MMFKAVLPLLAFMLFSCEGNKTEPSGDDGAIEVAAASGQFDWLLGNWQRSNEAEGKETFEFWHKSDSDSYSGIGFTMQDGDTVFFEKLRIARYDDEWIFAVRPSKKKEATRFEMTDIGSSEFTCTNDSNDFPSKINYWREGEKLMANVSNSEFEIWYEFNRQLENRKLFDEE